MIVVILAAGYGTRLREIAENTPKPLLPINGRPLLEYVLDCLGPLPDITRTVVVTNNKFYGQFLEWAGKQTLHFPVEVVNDGTDAPEERLGSIGDIQYAIESLAIKDDIIVVGGDNLFDFDLRAFQEFSRGHKENVSIGVYDIEDLEEARLFGVVALDGQGRVMSFEEKPDQPKSSLVAMCFYYFPESTVPLVGEYLKQTEKSDRAGDYIRWLCEKSQVYGFQFKGRWYDIGSIESYYEAQNAFKR